MSRTNLEKKTHWMILAGGSKKYLFFSIIISTNYQIKLLAIRLDKDTCAYTYTRVK